MDFLHYLCIKILFCRICGYFFHESFIMVYNTFKNNIFVLVKTIINILYKWARDNKFLATFTVVVLLLAFIRLIFPSVVGDKFVENKDADYGVIKEDYINKKNTDISNLDVVLHPKYPLTRFYDDEYNVVRHRINSVPGFSRTFPDNNDIQLSAANMYGVKPVEDRADAEHRKKELVFVGASPYFHVDPLRNSIPYLVPRAAVLLNEIGRAYYDSLQVKGIPLHQIIVTSVLRSRSDVRNLRGHNANATENSCHLYGTTFDVCYNRYKTVSPVEGAKRRSVRNDTLKWGLSEVLRDMREAKRCYVKYEVKQGCFHITVR